MTRLYYLSVDSFIIIYFCGFDPPFPPKRPFGKSGGGGQPFVYTPNASDDFDPFLENFLEKIFLKV
jgi:hypothetical protein